jgi:hypothetical protein
MKFTRKLFFFGIGVVLGTAGVVWMFGDRTDIQCTYFPNDRVLYDLRLKRWEWPAGNAPVDTSWTWAIRNRSTVDWKASTVAGRTEAKQDSTNTYVLNVEYQGKPTRVRVEGRKHRAVVLEWDGPKR